MMRIQNIIRASVVMITLLFLSCVKSEDSFQNATVKLRLEGGIGVTIPDAAADTRAEAIQPTVETLRVLTFNSSGALMGNVLLQGNQLGIAADASNHWIITIPNNTFVEASYGDNHVYVVLNESVAGITEQLTAANLTQTQMETIRGGKVAYNELIPVTEGSEPPFIMCVYDVVNVSQSQATLNLTGLGDGDYGEPTYGFPMRRTMAKIVLESVYGGVGVDGKIIGTDITYNPSSTTDQTGTEDIVTLGSDGKPIAGSTGNVDLAYTSEVFVSKLEILNVPTEYSWAQEKDDSLNNVTSSASSFLPAQDVSNAYVLPENPIPSQNYMQRVWNGSIVASGSVGFARIDSFPIFYKQEANKGVNSYDIGEAYPFASEPDPTSDDAEFNSGNFIPWVTELYGGDHIIEGVVTPKLETLDLTSDLDPAAWSVATVAGKNEYYIPENIQTNNPANQTMLRVHLSIGNVMVNVDEEEIQRIINESLAAEKIPIIKEDGTQITITGKDVSYVIQQAKAIQNPTTIGDGLGSQGQAIVQDLAWGICYDGINAIWSGTYEDIKDQQGYYFVDVTSKVTNFYVDIPLYNNDAPNDHNIYRGHEYKVKLYITRQNGDDNWVQKSNSNRSITYHQLPTMTRSGAEDLCIAAEVVTSTSAN